MQTRIEWKLNEIQQASISGAAELQVADKSLGEIEQTTSQKEGGTNNGKPETL